MATKLGPIMPKKFDYLDRATVDKHRKHLAGLLDKVGGLTAINQTGIIEYEIWHDEGRKLAEGLTEVGVPARHNGGKQVLIFSDEYPFYAQNRVCINKVAKEIIRIATE